MKYHIFFFLLLQDMFEVFLIVSVAFFIEVYTWLSWWGKGSARSLFANWLISIILRTKQAEKKRNMLFTGLGRCLFIYLFS